ncbi:MAG TPA: 1-acyl-sn-glycerol-3-phosphate acyltransferase [Prolixibacteraceae bacterium]|jgi:1-acyl-sn-glycerol-3-phosphate acyltransferase|nr:1-acyl-sn-glycerol-3-phosphate acyltransferase [Prolixibacteraceae bacterium]
MKTILSYILTPVYMLIFGLLLLVFHPIQMVTRWIWGYPVRKKAVDILNFGLLYSLWILGTRITYKGLEKIPRNRPLIIVANHQSTLDIPAVIIGFRKNHPKFISKIELGKGIPSISYNLRYGGSVLIDRKNKSQSVKDILMLGKHIEKNNYSACIFPEGTRTKTGLVGSFQPAGIASLIRTSPSAIIIPFAIDGHFQLSQNKKFPMTFGSHLKYTVLDPIEPKGMDSAELAQMIEDGIRKELGQEKVDNLS